MTITMYDSVNISQLPKDAQAYAGYVNGHWPTYTGLKAKFPLANILSIAVTAAADAECLDIETGDAINGQAPGWVKRQLARGVKRPVLYTSVSNVNALVHILAMAGYTGDDVRIWSAHYGAGEHICGPTTCKQTMIDCDGTQWTDMSHGINLDQSLLNDDFFNPGGQHMHLNKPIAAIVATNSGQGYWLVGEDGGIFAFGDAPVYESSLPNQVLAAPITGAVRADATNGLYLCGGDGGVFAFGSAIFKGSIPGLPG